MGWTDDQIQNMVDFERRDDFTPREKAALRLADGMTLDAHGIDDAQWAELRNHFFAIISTKAKFWNCSRPSACSITSTDSMKC